jgi:hypothetical protein
MIDTIAGRRREKSRIKALSPDMGVIPVVINAKTTIWIKEGQDPEERRAMYLERIWRQEQADKKTKFL